MTHTKHMGIAKQESWPEMVERLKSEGMEVFTPNGLQISAICNKGDGTQVLTEHEHALHPDYKFPVEVTIINRKPHHLTDERYGYWFDETHALIYADDSMAVTLYEYTYHMWHLHDGKSLNMRFLHFIDTGEKVDYRLTKESIGKISVYVEKSKVAKKLFNQIYASLNDGDGSYEYVIERNELK